MATPVSTEVYDQRSALRPAYRLPRAELRGRETTVTFLLAKEDAVESSEPGAKKPASAKEGAPAPEGTDPTNPLILPRLDAAPAENGLPLNPQSPTPPRKVPGSAMRLPQWLQGEPESNPTTPATATTPASPESLKPIIPVVPNNISRRGLRMLDGDLQGEIRDPSSGTRWFDAPLYNDPLVRAASFNAVPLSESILDGLGGAPTVVGSDLSGTVIPSGARQVRLGPITLRSSVFFSVDYEHLGGAAPGRTDQIQSSGNVAVSASDLNKEMSSGFSQNGLQASSDVFSLSTGVAFDFLVGEPATGHFMTVSYSAAFRERTEELEKPFNQTLNAVGRLSFDKISLGLGVSFASLSGVNRDVGGEADRDLLGISLNASYPIGAKTSLDWDITLPIKQVSGGIDSGGFSSSHSLNYTVDPKLSIGLGYSFGFERDRASDTFRAATKEIVADQNASSDVNRLNEEMAKRANRTQTFQRVFTRFSFRASPKLSFFGDVGLELRDDEGDSQLHPTMDVGASWSPRPTTSVSFSLQQTTSGSSSLAGQNVVSTTLQLGLSQQLHPRLSAVLAFSYEHASYEASGMQSPSSMSRVDDLFNVQAGLSLAISERWTASLTYSYGDNVSSAETFSFTTSRIQLQTSLAF